MYLSSAITGRQRQNIAQRAIPVSLDCLETRSRYEQGEAGGNKAPVVSQLVKIHDGCMTVLNLTEVLVHEKMKLIVWLTVDRPNKPGLPSIGNNKWK